jgi:hypothetical protein
MGMLSKRTELTAGIRLRAVSELVGQMHQTCIAASHVAMCAEGQAVQAGLPLGKGTVQLVTFRNVHVTENKYTPTFGLSF